MPIAFMRIFFEEKHGQTFVIDLGLCHEARLLMVCFALEI